MTSHDVDFLLEAFRELNVPEEMLPRGLQRRLIDELAALYERKGLMSGVSAPPLYNCCPNAHACWKNRDEWRPTGGWSGVSLPWIGPDYPERGVVVVLGINMNQYGGPPAAFVLASYEHEHFGRGRKLMRYGNPHYKGGLLAYGTTRPAACVLDKLDGNEIEDHEKPRELAGPLLRIARWNAGQVLSQPGARQAVPRDVDPLPRNASGG
jgi:hypothetical protein